MIAAKNKKPPSMHVEPPYGGAKFAAILIYK